MPVSNHRRYCLLKAQVAGDRHEDGMRAAWWGKQDAAGGAALPDGFPSKAALATAHYTNEEDLEGATVKELKKRAGLTRTQAEAVLAALED